MQKLNYDHAPKGKGFVSTKNIHIPHNMRYSFIIVYFEVNIYL